MEAYKRAWVVGCMVLVEVACKMVWALVVVVWAWVCRLVFLVVEVWAWACIVEAFAWVVLVG